MFHAYSQKKQWTKSLLLSHTSRTKYVYYNLLWNQNSCAIFSIILIRVLEYAFSCSLILLCWIIDCHGFVICICLNNNAKWTIQNTNDRIEKSFLKWFLLTNASVAAVALIEAYDAWYWCTCMFFWISPFNLFTSINWMIMV